MALVLVNEAYKQRFSNHVMLVVFETIHLSQKRVFLRELFGLCTHNQFAL